MTIKQHKKDLNSKIYQKHNKNIYQIYKIKLNIINYGSCNYIKPKRIK